MTLVITRGPSTDEGTFSTGQLDGDLTWEFVELPWRDNATGLSCIPEGIYQARIVHSQHFGRPVYLIMDVPGRDNIEMHPANWGGDTVKGYYSDLRGCCAPGTALGHLMTPRGRAQAAVLNSGLALDQLMEAAGENLEIEFTWAEEDDNADSEKP